MTDHLQSRSGRFLIACVSVCVSNSAVMVWSSLVAEELCSQTLSTFSVLIGEDF